MTSFSVRVPQAYSVAEVSGTGLIGTSEPDGKGVMRVPVNFEVKGDYALRVTVDRTLEEASFSLPLPVVVAMEVEQQKGHLGVQVTSGAEIKPRVARGVIGRDFSELPRILAAEARNPIVLAFAYRKSDFKVELDVKRHTPMAVLDAAVDEANLVMQLTVDGKGVTRAVYRVRNNNRQFMRLRLPAGSQLWSAHVNGRPVKPALSKPAGPDRVSEILPAGRPLF